MTFTHALPSGNYGPAKFIVSANVYEGTHTTIAAALTSAASGDTIFIRPGTYTENLTLKAGVDLCAFECDAQNPNVTIAGTCTFTAAGTVSLSGIRLQTNSAFCLAITGSAASIVKLTSCYIDATNNTAISMTSSSASSLLYMTACTGNIATTGITYFSVSGAGTVRMIDGYFQNSGLSSTANSFSAGSFFPFMVAFDTGFAMSGTSVMSGQFCSWNAGVANATAMNITTSNQCGANFCTFNGGTSSAISVGSGSQLNLDNADVSSSNTNAITGAGTIRYGLITYTGSSTTNNVSTQTPFTTQPAIGTSSGQVIQQIRSSTVTKTQYTSVTSIPYDDTIPQSNEGANILSATITPTNASNILWIQAMVNFGIDSTVNNQGGLGIWLGATANSTAMASYWIEATTVPSKQALFSFYIVAGTTSSSTYTLRFGGNNTSSLTINGGSNVRAYGGVLVTSMSITEIQI